MGTYNGSDKRLQYLFENGGGGGGGTTVVANPSGQATDTLNKLQVGSNIYSIPSGGSGGDIYSTSEIVIGEWLGKPLYRKVFTTNTLNINQRSGNLYSGAISISTYLSNIDKIFINAGKSWVNISGVTRLLLGAYQQNDTLAIYTEVERLNCTLTLTVEYTKTTD